MHALYPRAQVAAARVDAHSTLAADGVLNVHLTRYIADPPDDLDPEPDSLDLHLWAVDPPVWDKHRHSVFPRYQAEKDACHRYTHEQYEIARRADVIMTAALDRPPMLVLDEKMRQFPSTYAIGVQTDRREGQLSCLVGLRTQFAYYRNATDARPADSLGYAVTMTATPNGTHPPRLYPSALLGWARWWIAQAKVLSDRTRDMEQLPPPPLQLDITEAWRTFRVDLTEPERTRWPTVPAVRRGWRQEYGFD
ncbi:hypothetical protein ACIBUY_04020 [Streptomyces sp. NPDC050085]|uniref:hypothetical protein n=1 Tax=Streptomyces sp. NPDC050085 TaxID=3365600 RepID=UPI0037B2A95C